VGTLEYPDEHAVAVAECAERIAEELRLPLRERRAVVEGALLHDVGKVTIEPDILNKPGPLTDTERERVQQHAAEGEKLLGELVDEDVRAIVRAHHERWDGAGYPEGIADEQIPMAARVVAVADAFLAMREERPYRRARSLAAALYEMQACAGSQFDPRCVDALAASVRGH
jgi:putative nucleotidyltransferase with HDIG domain